MSIFGHSILAMALSTLWFVGGHFLLSHPLRGPIVQRLGIQGFRLLYIAVASIGLVWMIRAHASAPHVVLWGDPLWARHLLLPIMAIAVALLVLGSTTTSPGLVGAEGVAMNYNQGLGIHAITRHPGLWGFALWAVGHMIANGDAATAILTLGIAVLAIGGMHGIDRRKSASHAAQYLPFMTHTSIIPFAALASGRTRIDWRKIGLWRLLLALAIFFALLFGHDLVIGRSALPLR